MNDNESTEAESATTADLLLIETRLLDEGTPKLLPDSVTESPGSAMLGVMLEIEGGATLPVRIVKERELVEEPNGAVTDIGPVVAPLGTVAIIWFTVADTMDAAIPLNETIS